MLPLLAISLMNWLAMRMLLGNRAKYVAMLFGLTFASLLICQQCAIFCGVMEMCTGQIRDVEDAGIWVLAPQVRYIDDLRPLDKTQVEAVRSVPGVAWAVPLRKGHGRVHLDDGRFQQVILMGLDDATLVGAPRTMILGKLAAIEQPDALIIDEMGHQLLWPDEPLRVGREVTLNERRAVVVGICRASLTFQTLPIFYTRLSQAAHYLPPERRTVSAILVQGQDGLPPEEVCRRISKQTGLLALTRDEFAWRTIDHYLTRTGLLLNFGTTVLLGFMVGVAISGQSFYTFTVENLPQFGMLKAMGTSDRRLLSMILLQAGLVGSIGYGAGVGLAAIFGELTRGHSKLVFFMPWQVLVITGLAVLLVTMSASVLSIRRVLRLEPAIVIR
jgi:putative ABC transport system permease protein